MSDTNTGVSDRFCPECSHLKDSAEDPCEECGHQPLGAFR